MHPPLASGFCITKTHLATPLLYGICFAQYLRLGIFSYSQLFFWRNPILIHNIAEHTHACRRIVEYAITHVMKVFSKQNGLCLSASMMLHPDFIHAAAVLASGKAGLRPPMRVSRTRVPAARPPRNAAVALPCALRGGFLDVWVGAEGWVLFRSNKRMVVKS